jgi:iron complex outermembrane receptor protein
MNHTRVDAMGGEAQIAMKKDKWNISVGYSFTNLNQQLDPDYQDYISKYALDYLRHKATLQFGHPIWKGFGANWVFSYQQRHGDYLDINNQTCAYKPVFLLDGRIFWAQTFAGKYGVEVYVEGSNLLNISYYDYGGIAQPGRWLKAGISLKI